jgi:hypothetical protein
MTRKVRSCKVVVLYLITAQKIAFKMKTPAVAKSITRNMINRCSRGGPP